METAFRRNEGVTALGDSVVDLVDETLTAVTIDSEESLSTNTGL
jgi:hypothetical protein